ncbi:MAG: DUF192 domain-containing protein [Opitutales bacterium]|jgi:uncharacterized membrane protein (UPF0127 family)
MQKGLKFFSLLAILFLCACGPEKSKTAIVAAEAWLPLQVGNVVIEARLAVTLSEKQKGLMYCRELGPEQGMLFPYESPRRVSFWMANTPLPLDLGLFDAQGILREIHRLVPYDTTTVTSRSEDIQYALEMNSGWFAGKKLYPGIPLDLKTLSLALEARGKNSRQYGLPE